VNGIDVAKRKKKEGGWRWDGHGLMQSTWKVRRCEQMGREGRKEAFEEEGESMSVLIDEDKSGGRPIPYPKNDYIT
jgi:hypothetical protein